VFLTCGFRTSLVPKNCAAGTKSVLSELEQGHVATQRPRHSFSARSDVLAYDPKYPAARMRLFLKNWTFLVESFGLLDYSDLSFPRVFETSFPSPRSLRSGFVL
jgi:hypothetical protein